MRPLVWLLFGARRGDNDQIELLARMLGVEAVAKPLRFGPLHMLPGWALGASLAGLKPEARSLIAPPWPDLVIAAGKRAAPVSRFVKKVSGGHTKLVHIGRPRAPLSAFDLVITTPQYGLPRDPNVMELALPFARPKPVTEQELAEWRARWAELPRPRTAVAIGAGKFPQRLGKVEALRLAGELAKLAGSLIVMASPRTEGRVMAILEQQLPTARLHAWGDGPNPYQAALALADRFVVTSDSLSMLSEAMETGKPANVFRLPVSPFHVHWNAQTGILAALARSGLLSPPRNMGAVVDRLIVDHAVRVLGKSFSPPQGGGAGVGGGPERDSWPPPTLGPSPLGRDEGFGRVSSIGRDEALRRVRALLA